MSKSDEWTYCGEGSEKPCQCGMIWSKKNDCPIAKVIIGEWGDEYPAIRIKSPGSINEPAEPYMEKIIYGSVNADYANENIQLIVSAPALQSDNARVREALAELYDAYCSIMKSEFDFPGRPWTPDRDNDVSAIKARAALNKEEGS